MTDRVKFTYADSTILYINQPSTDVTIENTYKTNGSSKITWTLDLIFPANCR